MVIGEQYGLADGRRVSEAMREVGAYPRIRSVNAPEVLKAIGINMVNSYPVYMLQKVLQHSTSRLGDAAYAA